MVFALSLIVKEWLALGARGFGILILQNWSHLCVVRLEKSSLTTKDLKDHQASGELHLRHSGRDSRGSNYGIHYGLYPNRGVDHQIVEFAVVPLQSEIAAYVSGTVAVHMLQLFQRGLRRDMRAHVLQLLFATAVDKDMESIDPAG